MLLLYVADMETSDSISLLTKAFMSLSLSDSYVKLWLDKCRVFESLLRAVAFLRFMLPRITIPISSVSLHEKRRVKKLQRTKPSPS